MKRFFLLLLVSCSVSIFAQSKKGTNAVAVLEFQKTGTITNDDVLTLTNRFRAMLFQTNTFNVIERQKMRDILKEQQFILSDECSTNECAVQVGQLLGVEYMIAGDIGLIGDTYTIDLRMIDVSTGQIVQTNSKDYDGKIAGLLEIMKQIANNFSQFQKGVSKANTELKKVAISDTALAATRDLGKTKESFWGARNKSRNLTFRLFFGPATPTGKFNSDLSTETGSNLMISCSYYFTSKVQLGIDFGVQSFKHKYWGKTKTVPFMFTGRYYTIDRKYKNYVSLGLGTAKVTSDPLTNGNFGTAKLGTGVSYDVMKNISAEMSLDFVSVGTKGSNVTSTQFGFGINYDLAF